MIDQRQFENLDFIETVNLIPEWAFPSSYPMHWHIYIEILFIPLHASKDATLSVVVNQETYILHRGDILLIWPGELHEILPNDTHFINAIQFSPELLGSRPEFSAYYHIYRHNHIIAYKDSKETCTEMLLHLQNIVEEHDSKNEFKGVEMVIEIYRCFITYTVYLTTQQDEFNYPTHSLNEHTIQKIQNACSYINKNCTKPLSLEDVASHAGFSSYYFSRIFKLVTDYPFTKYVTLQRIRYAQQLLSDSSLSITDIAFSSGFKSIATFNRVFKEYKGYSPRDFRALFLRQF